jgi:hypothetical protein
VVVDLMGDVGVTIDDGSGTVHPPPSVVKTRPAPWGRHVLKVSGGVHR